MVQVDRGEHLRAGEWLDPNREYWEGRADDGAPLRAFAAAVPAGARVLHLQCGSGADALELAERGEDVIGVDFSMPAIRRAREAARERGLAERSRFVCANVYELRHMLPEPDAFDAVVTTLDAVAWLPDVEEWARIVEWFLAPGGTAVIGSQQRPRVVDAAVRTWERSSDEIAAALSATRLDLAAGAVDGVAWTASKRA
ncbi:class I SAM-dependent methyltransferase [Rathayibacter sp. VKM Ac-2856]|uniref:class I SAM-dependent methyltransferase n=1 Tax=unclassified Rathayibacter TaxID=2609250 RepID=UPI0015675AFD|nr:MULTISPECIES: methyltransferase domain-containing protein [unclassified Rathayibacter]NQX06368.1 class I SAM-dependent methyltransferase [Rathayibacter sp. VKM Ac-2858]NQX21535.1 class I SAM-dependent methyltransferase [Rathayibacter sp. VKM Ac-2856]